MDGAAPPKRSSRSETNASQAQPRVLVRKTPNSSGDRVRINYSATGPPTSSTRDQRQGQSPGVLARRPGLPRPGGGLRGDGPRGGSTRGDSPRGGSTRGGGAPAGRPSGGRFTQRGPRDGPSSRRGGRSPGSRPDSAFDEYVDNEDLSSEDAIKRRQARDRAEAETHQIEKHEADLEAADANNGLPTTAIAYSPAEQTVTELRKDWPDTPLSASGLSEGVVQKLRWLAKDLPHGYWTPQQIAERFVEGGLVRFDNAEHKEKVMGRVETVLRQKLEREMKSDGREAIEAAVAESAAAVGGFTALGQKEGEVKALVDGMVRGVYPGLEKGQRPLLASVQRQLRNNGSYQAADTGKLVGRINTLIESTTKQAAQQKAAAAAKQ